MMPFGADSSSAYVPVMVQVAGGGLVSEDSEGQLPLEFYAYASSEEGEVKDFFGEKLTFDLDAVGHQIAGTGVRFYGHLDLEPGDYAVRMMVRDARTGASSVEVVPLSVPDFSVEHLAVMPPLIPQGMDRWVSVRENKERAGLRVVDYPFMFKDQAFVPAVQPTFQSDQVVAVSLVASSSNDGYLEVGSLILKADGTPAPGTHLRVLEREKIEGTGLERMVAIFEVPNLPGGDYSLVVTMSDPAVGTIESGTLEFRLGQRTTSSALFDPPRWMPDLSEIVKQLGPANPQAVPTKIDKRAVLAGYKAVLSLMAEGRSMSAVLALAELETGSLSATNPMSSLAQIRRVQEKLLAAVSRDDPELILPAILLHREAYSQYRLREQSYLAVHARNTALRLIDEYADRARAGNPEQLASRILTSMAPEVYESGAHISAMRMFDRAIELDQLNGVALTGLGFMLETTGREERTPTYEDAVALFERAVAAEPDLHEARLRLAVNLQRLERHAEAGREFNTLITSEGVPDWVTSLAFQEMATLYSGMGDWDQARKVLERGTERLPEETKLALQLSYVNERLQRQYQATRAIENARGGGTAARYLYLQVPQPVSAEKAGKWKERAETQMSDLTRALARSAAGVTR
jgi:tetratricopeptide (TPR) repeat protein